MIKSSPLTCYSPAGQSTESTTLAGNSFTVVPMQRQLVPSNGFVIHQSIIPWLMYILNLPIENKYFYFYISVVSNRLLQSLFHFQIYSHQFVLHICISVFFCACAFVYVFGAPLFNSEHLAYYMSQPESTPAQSYCD